MSRSGIACLVVLGGSLLAIEALGRHSPPASGSFVSLAVSAPFADEPVRVSSARLAVRAGHAARLTGFTVDWLGETRTVALQCDARPEAPCQFAAELASALRAPERAGTATVRVRDFVLEPIDSARASLPRLAPVAVELQVAPARAPDDGFVLLERAAALCDPKGELVRGLERRDEGWTEAQRKRADALLAERADCLDMARRALAARELTAAVPSGGAMSPEPTLAQAAVPQWFSIAGRAAEERGAASEATAHYSHMLALALRVSSAIQLRETVGGGLEWAWIPSATRSLERTLAAEPRFDAPARADLAATIELARTALDRMLPVQTIVDAREAQMAELFRPLRYDPVSLVAGKRGEPETTLAVVARPNHEHEAVEADQARAVIDRLDALLRSTAPVP